MTTEGEAGGRLAASQGRRGALAEELFSNCVESQEA